MLFSPHVIEEIASCAHWADRLVRSDLIDDLVVSENDYTSNFTAALRREINARGIVGLKARIQVLNASAERKLGADACVILQNPTQYKAAIFEAKWPRLSTHVNTWDSKQKSTGHSHFHSQLERQHVQRHHLAIWEMFYLEHPFGKQPSYMPDNGSACVWHDDAYAASHLRATPTDPWEDPDLLSMIEDKGCAIEQIFRDICECHKGTPIPTGNYTKAFGDGGAPYEALIISYTPRGQ